MLVDCIYILNLDRLKYRYYEVLERLNKIGINRKNQKIIRWSAIDGSKDLPYSENIYSNSSKEEQFIYLDKLNNTLKNYNYISKKTSITYKPGQIGCYYSFIQILQNAKKNNYNKIIIFEDDVFFVENFLEEFEKISNLKSDLIYLGNSHLYWNDKGSYFFCPEKKVDNAFVEYPFGCLNESKERTNSFLGNFGLLVNKSAYDPILQYAYPMRYPIDVYFGKLYFQNLITVRFLKNHIVYVDYNEGVTHTSTLVKDGTKYKEYH